jgi:hypothetical protein
MSIRWRGIFQLFDRRRAEMMATVGKRICPSENKREGDQAES